MKILVVGAGGREHALAWKIKQSPLLRELFIAPGNPGTAQLGTNVDIPLENIGALALWAVDQKIDLTIVGPEQPLSDGLVDVFRRHGLKVIGPSQAAAQLEASKAFAKEVMLRAGIQTAEGEIFDDFELAKQYVESKGAPIVIKADGLAAGKGVVVAESVEEAFTALHSFMVAGSLGSSGRRVVVERKIEGREASIMALVDRDVVLPLVDSQDYKRIFDGDRGPNTGGMGAISPTPVLENHRMENIVGEIFLPVVNELMNRGIPYTGFLYAGVMIDPQGKIWVLEFNCRLGDPETQVIMMRMQSDLVEVLHAAAEGQLRAVSFEWKSDSAACVVCASKGYPGAVEDKKEIHGLWEPESDLVVFHAGTGAREDGAIISKGGRVLTVAATAPNINSAVERAYSGVARVQFEGMQHRKDIGGGAW